MFGMGFLEIMLILIVAVIALGPEKLPSAAVDIAKMLKKIKGSVDDVKSSVNSELNLSEMKSEAEKFKDSMGVDRLASLNMNNIIDYNDINENDDNKQKKTKKKIKKENSKNKKIDASYKEVKKEDKTVQNENDTKEKEV